jgi:hypothetical protein
MKRVKTFLVALFLFIQLCCCLNLFAQDDVSNWFPFKPTNTGNSRINMQHWLDAPAGKHGFVNMKESNLFFDNGKQVKFWGVNIASERPFLPREIADKWVNFMAAYGINAVRFHKFTWDATDGVHSTELAADKWSNFDYFTSKLKQQGIYVGWSHIYGHRVLPADSSRLLAYSEVAGTRFPWSHLNGTTASLVNFADDLQALNIELTVNMLNHRNPNTGLRYADDPALAFVELQNEDNIFWAAIETTLKQTPTYKALLCRKFSDWLFKKYKTQTMLVKAWGRNNLPIDQTIEKKNIYPQPNHGFFSYESEKAWNNKEKLPQHVIDKAMFLYEEQDRFYRKFVMAIRNTGYKGLIIGSCWQAGSGLAHLLNLRADYNAGVIDRHNYFGGGTGHTLTPGKVRNQPMVNNAGSGLLSTGFQQVKDRPFFASEWMSLIPNEWTAESAPIIAAYGLGLQDWDASFAFAMDYDHFTPTIQSGHGVYNVTSPTQLALYPALASMVYRNDLKPAEIIAERKVTLDQLKNGKLPFFEKVEQEADIKKFQSTLPLAVLAKGRIVVSFEDGKNNSSVTAETIKANASIKSSTGQLEWNEGEKGFFTINSKGTQGMVGFAAGREIKLDDISFKTSNEFAVVLIYSNEKDKDIATSKSIIVTTIARARNSGMKYSEKKDSLLDVGKAPLLLEPVILDLQINKRNNLQVYVLDHSGNRTGEKILVTKGRMLLDGSKYKAIYYEIVSD